MTAKGWATFARLRVRHLGLVAPALSAGAMTGLPEMPPLETLTLTGAELGADGTTQLGRCGRLQELNLSGSKFGPSASRELAGLSKLQRLDVSFTENFLKESDVGDQAKLTRLRTRNVSETPLAVDALSGNAAFNGVPVAVTPIADSDDRRGGLDPDAM